jgi:hypothetical protein
VACAAISIADDVDWKLLFAFDREQLHSLIAQRAIRALPATRRPSGDQEHPMSNDYPPLYDNTLTGVLARLTHGILLDADQRAQQDSAARANTSANSVCKASSWLDRLDTWFWKQEMKRHEAFLAQSTDVFDLERRMRMLERGVK